MLSLLMRNTFVLLTVCLALALPAAAQNTDIESLSGLQFNFGNPGARSLGMGGAFLGLADDASAAEANPAGLTILRKPEISLERSRATTGICLSPSRKVVTAVPLIAVEEEPATS